MTDETAIHLLSAWQQRQANSARGVTVRPGDVIWSPVHRQALHVVSVTQTAAYVVALPDQPAGADLQGKCVPGDPRQRAVSKFVSGDPWSLGELTAANQDFLETLATLTRPVAASGAVQPLPGQPRPEGAEETTMAKTKAKKEKKAAAPKEKKGPRLFAMTEKEATAEDFARGGGLYGNAGNVFRAAKRACAATVSGKASSEAIAGYLERNEKHESSTDPLILTRAYLSKVVAAGFMTADQRGGAA